MSRNGNGVSDHERWNMSYALSGELSREMDPYFPFENAPEVWGRSFAAMGIKAGPVLPLVL